MRPFALFQRRKISPEFSQAQCGARCWGHLPAAGCSLLSSPLACTFWRDRRSPICQGSAPEGPTFELFLGAALGRVSICSWGDDSFLCRAAGGTRASGTIPLRGLFPARKNSNALPYLTVSEPDFGQIIISLNSERYNHIDFKSFWEKK